MHTFGEEYLSIQSRYESRHAASAVIMEAAVLIERSLVNIFKQLIFELPEKDDRLRYIEFEEQLRRKYPQFPNQMMLGQCIGVFRDFGKKFPDNLYLADDMLERLNLLNSIRKKVAHPEKGRITEADAATALKQAREVLKKIGVWDREIAPIGVALESYLTYRKTKENFQHPSGEEDYRLIIQSSAVLLPPLLRAIVARRFVDLNLQQKKTLLESSTDLTGGDDHGPLDSYASTFEVIDIYKLLEDGPELARELSYIASSEDHLFSRLTAASYMQALDICFKNLISDETEKYLEYANWVQEFCISKRRIRRQDRLKLSGIASQLDIPPQTADKIQQSVQTILRNQGHDDVVWDDEAPTAELAFPTQPPSVKKKGRLLVVSAVAVSLALLTLFIYMMMTEPYAANRFLSSLLNVFQLRSEPEVWEESTTGMTFIHVNGDCFEMGCRDAASEQCPPFSRPSHTVCLDDFWIGKYEITQRQWEIIMGANPAAFKSCGGDCPVEMVSWDDAHEFIEKLSDQTGERFRLPTEAEWEFACRSGGKKDAFSGTGAVPSDVAWFSFNSGGSTRPIGRKLPNDLGLYDMSGNVWEWCEDGFLATAYENLPEKNPILGQGATRVIRGGAWDYSVSELACYFRADRPPNRRTRNIGLRLVKAP